MADLEAFLTGYMTSRAAKMQRDQDKAEKERSRLEALSMRNEVIGRNRTAAYDSAQNMANQLMSWGATPEMIQASVKSGVKNLPEFYNTVKGIHSTLGTEGTKKYFDQEGEYIQTDLGGATPVTAEGIPELLRATYGLPSGTVVGDYQAPEQSLLGKLFGKSNARERMIAELDAQQSAVGGYSVYDLTTLSALPDYLPGSQGESITFRQPTIYTSQNFSDEIETLKRNFDDLATVNDPYAQAKDKVGEAYKALIPYRSDIKKINEDTSLSEEDRQKKIEAITSGQAYQNAKATYDIAQGELDKIGNDVMGYLVEKQASQYFNASKYYEDVNEYVKRMYGVNLFSPEQIQEQKDIEDFVANSQAGGLTGTTPTGTTPTETTRTVTTPQGAEIEITTVDGVEKVKAKDGTLLPDDESNAILDALREEQPFDMPEAFVEGYNMPSTEMADVSSPEDKAAEARKQAERSAEEIAATYQKGVEITDAVNEATSSGIAVMADFLDRGIGYIPAMGNDMFASLTTGAAYLTEAAGFPETANGLYVAAYDMAKGAEGMRDKGFFENAYNAAQREDYPESAFVAATTQYLGNLVTTSEQAPMGDVSEEEAAGYKAQQQAAVNKLTGIAKAAYKAIDKKMSADATPEQKEALQRAPEHIEKLGDQAMDAWRKLTAEVQDFKVSDLKTPDEENPMVKLITGFIGEDNLKAYQEGRLAGEEKEAMEERIRDDARQFLQDEKSFPQPLPKIVIDAIVEEAPQVVSKATTDLGDMTGAPGFRSDERPLTEIIADQRTLAVDPTYISYEEWDSMSKAERKAIKLDVSKTRIENMVREGRIPLPRGAELPDRLVEMRMASMPTPAESGELPDLPRNMAVESMLTRRERGPGLMRRPSDPELGDMPVPEEANKASALVDLRSVMARVHGKKSKAVKELDKIVQQSNRGVPIQYTDVNRLLRMTKSLRKSATRDTLIEQLAILANEARK